VSIHYAAMMTGDGIYLIDSLLFWTVAYLVGRAVVGNDINNTLFRIANGFGVFSACPHSEVIRRHAIS
jgi:hypothetical protein